MNEGSLQEGLSAEEFRRRLYSHFEKRGVVDQLKTQMRHLLVKELQECVPGGNIFPKSTPASTGDHNSLLVRAANSLVADHLQKCNYEYTMGIFIPESGTYPDKMFSMADLLQLLHINPSSELYKKLFSQISSYSKKGFLWQLLCELSSLHSSTTVSTSVQTDFMPQYSVSTLDEKLNGVEQIYHDKKEKHNQNAMLGLEEKFVSIQRELEKRYEKELQSELVRVKENDLVKFRLEEKEKCRKELELSKQELEKTYQLRSNALRERERNFTERLQKEEDMLLKETYIQRQSLLEEINALRERDAGITRTLEGINREKVLHEEKMRSQEELLRQKLNEVNRLELEYHQRLQTEINKFKLEEQKKILEKSQELDKRENQVRITELRIAEDEQRMQSLKNEVQEKNDKINELEVLLQEARRTEASLVKNNEYLSSKLTENIVSRREFETEKMHHAETTQLNECLKMRQESFMKESLQLNQEMARVKQEMEKVRNELHQEKVVYENYKKQLEEKFRKEITDNRTHNQKLIQQFEEQTEEIKTLNQEMSQVQNKLMFAQEALKNEITKKKKNICSRSLNTQRRSRDNCFQQSLRTTRKPKTPIDYKYLLGDYTCEDEFSSCGLQGSGQDADFTDGELTNDDSSNLIAQNKYGQKILEEQMKNIKHEYQCFQNRLKKGTSSPSRTSTIDEVASENVFKKPKKKLQYLVAGHRDTSPVRSQIETNSGSQSPKTLASTPRKESNSNESSRKGHSISVLPQFDISQLTGEEGDRSVDEGSPVAAVISERSKTKKQEKQKAEEEASTLPTDPSSVMGPATTAEEVLSSLVASQPILDACQTASIPDLPSYFAPISVHPSSSALTQMSAPTLISTLPLSSKLIQVSAPIPISTPPNFTAPAPVSASTRISAPPSPVPPTDSTHTHVSARAPISAFVPISLSPPLPSTPASPLCLPVSTTSVSPASISVPLSVASPPHASTFSPPVSGLAQSFQPSSLGHSYLTEKSPLEPLSVFTATNLPILEQSSIPVNTQTSVEPVPFLSLDDAWRSIKKSESSSPSASSSSSSSSYQRKSSNAEVSKQPKSLVQQEKEFLKKHSEQDNVDHDSVSKENIPGLESSAKERNLIKNPVLDKEDSSQIDTEIEEGNILTESVSNHNSPPLLDLVPSQKTNEIEKASLTKDKPEHRESENYILTGSGFAHSSLPLLDLLPSQKTSEIEKTHSTKDKPEHRESERNILTNSGSVRSSSPLLDLLPSQKTSELEKIHSTKDKPEHRESERNILTNSGSIHSSSQSLDLLPSQKTSEFEKTRSTKDKPEYRESEPEELHSDSLSQSHMSDSEVDDTDDNW